MSSSSSSSSPVCVVVGIGPGNGAAFARRFASEGYRVALLARRKELSGQLETELKGSKAYACDVSDAASVDAAFSAIPNDLGDIDVVIYNAGSGVWGSIEELSPEQFESSWRVNTLGAFLVSKAVIPGMKARNKGSIVFIGATASRRGMPKTCAFAPAKAAQKSLAESMARTLWPQNIHVSLIILDGAVNTKGEKAKVGDKPADFFIQPEDVASTAFWLTQQNKSAWSFEVEARPFGEKW